MTTPNPSVEKWEIKFDKKFPRVVAIEDRPGSFVIMFSEKEHKAIKSFISSQIKEAEKRMINKVKNEIRKLKVGESEGWDYFFSDRGRCCPGDDYSDIYNKALEEIRASLKKLEEEIGR